ncbi:uncharacterized protein ACRADG_005596 [Cochliomyia hominivorax]
MSYLNTFFEYIQSLCAADAEMNNAAKEIDEINRENTKIEKQSEELDREHDHLQIELHNIQSIVSQQHDKDVIAQFQQTSVQMYQYSIELNSLLHKIDFTKILQCHHMEMETKCHQEWQPFQEGFLKTVKWQEQMEQRSIVQKYRQTEGKKHELEEAYLREKETMEKSLKQSWEQTKEATEKRNELIVNLIKGTKDMEEQKKKVLKLKEYENYIEELIRGKLKLTRQLEKLQMEVFNPTLNPNATHKICTNSLENFETTNLITPQLPSFMEILNSFNKQPEKRTNITTIENTTEISIKSILHNSNNSHQSIITKQTKNVRFKMQLEEYQEDSSPAIYSEEIESETDVEIEVDGITNKMEVTESVIDKENLQEMKNVDKETEIETIDLLTPAETLAEKLEDISETRDSSDGALQTKGDMNKKPVIEIQECIVFKTPFPIQEVCKNKEPESEIQTSASGGSKSVAGNSFTSHSSNGKIKELLKENEKSFLDDFLNISTNSEISPATTTSQSKKLNKSMILNEFESFFEDNKEFLFASKESQEGETAKLIKTDDKSAVEVQDFLDFITSRGFTFDSDDNMNMSDKYKAGDMDFM